MVVSFSGIDGSGKTTQIDLLCNYCQSKGIKYIKKWSKARGTPGIYFIKNLVRRDKALSKDEKLEHRKEVFESGWKRRVLYVLSMLDLCWYWGIYFRIIKHRCDLLILDRYLWDTFVEVSTEFNIEHLERRFLWKCVKAFALAPDQSILLMIPAEESFRRESLREELTTESLDFKKKKMDLYMDLNQQKRWRTVLDSMKTVSETHKDILNALKFA